MPQEEVSPKDTHIAGLVMNGGSQNEHPQLSLPLAARTTIAFSSGSFHMMRICASNSPQPGHKNRKMNGRDKWWSHVLHRGTHLVP